MDTLSLLESGEIRAASPGTNGQWTVNPEVKKGILEAFRQGTLTEGEGAYRGFVDKGNLFPQSFSPDQSIRLVPGGSSVRRGSYIAPGVVIMPPSYVNVGAYVDEGSMIDSHALVGSCAQIGKRVHLSAGVQIGGVLEPIGQSPVIIEDDCFIGAGAVIVEGIRVCQGAVIAPGVTLSRSLRIYDTVNNTILEPGADIPRGAVVVSGTRPANGDFSTQQGLNLYTPIIIKYRDEKSDASLALEDALR